MDAGWGKPIGALYFWSIFHGRRLGQTYWGAIFLVDFLWTPAGQTYWGTISLLNFFVVSG